MDPKIKKLFAMLDEETTAYLEMEQVLKDEGDSIFFSKKEQFDHVQERKDELVFRLHQLEETRKPLVEELSMTYGLANQKSTVRQLAKRFEPASGEQLTRCADRLRATLLRVQEKNSRNQKLIHHQLDLVRGSIKILTHITEDRAVYHNNGVPKPSTGYRSGGGRVIRGSM